MKATLFYNPLDAAEQKMGSLRTYQIDTEKEKAALGIPDGWRWLEVSGQDFLDGLLNGGVAEIANGEVISVAAAEPTEAERAQRRKARAVALIGEKIKLEPIVAELGRHFDVSAEQARLAEILEELAGLISGQLQPEAAKVSVDGQLAISKHV